MCVFQDSEDSRDSTGSSINSAGDATGNECRVSSSEDNKSNSPCDSKMKGRTGWPQEVWASELKLSPNHMSIDITKPGTS